MRRFNIIIYAILEAFTIIYGVANLFFPTVLVKETAWDALSLTVD